MTKHYIIEYRIRSEAEWKRLKGRQAWTLAQLHKAGPRGCATIDRPAPRWSQYVMDLRRRGLAIETVREDHGGTFPGQHGRYVLHTEIDLRDDLVTLEPSRVLGVAGNRTNSDGGGHA